MATSKEFIKKAAENMGITQRHADEMAKGFETTVKQMLSEMNVDERIKVMDITFTKKDVPEREGRNPSTGETMQIPASKKIVLKPSIDLKRIVKE